LPTPGRTLSAQYVQPLLQILNHNYDGSTGPKGVYKASPNQSLMLLVDFKASDSNTLDSVVKALQSLRDAGYLSYRDGDKFIQRPITFYASGSAEFGRIDSGNGVPNHDVFYYAKVDY
jgi:hypothetical protein